MIFLIFIFIQMQTSVSPLKCPTKEDHKSLSLLEEKPKVLIQNGPLTDGVDHTQRPLHQNGPLDLHHLRHHHHHHHHITAEHRQQKLSPCAENNNAINHSHTPPDRILNGPHENNIANPRISSGNNNNNNSSNNSNNRLLTNGPTPPEHVNNSYSERLHNGPSDVTARSLVDRVQQNGPTSSDIRNSSPRLHNGPTDINARDRLSDVSCSCSIFVLLSLQF